MLLIMVSLHAQYNVEGGAGTPLLVKDDTPNRIQVYMVYGLDNVKISYTSSSTSHRWYRYNNIALETEPVSHTQEGSTSFIQGVEDGYGYFVEENGSLAASRYVWVIDYSRHVSAINNFYVSESNCAGINFQGDLVADVLYYYTPSGNRVTLPRQYELTYQTLRWVKDNLQFITDDVTNMITVSKENWEGYALTTNLPYCDTQFTFSGDLFARHFNVAKTITTELYQAEALLVDTTMYLTPLEADNMVGGNDDSAYSAPFEVYFRAYANEPVANLYIWRVYRGDDPEVEDAQELVRHIGEEFNYTFYSSGDFFVQLEVGNRQGTCPEILNSEVIKIRESLLEVPNVFTPGTSPGVNDEFKVAYKSLVSFKGWIFNRWGVQMFHWTDPAQGWDGKKGGKYVAPGVYYYVIEAQGSDGERYLKKGDINIIRPKKIQDEVIE